MLNAELIIIISANSVDGKQVIHNAPKIKMVIADFPFNPIKLIIDEDFSKKDCEICSNDFEKAGKIISAFKHIT